MRTQLVTLSSLSLLTACLGIGDPQAIDERSEALDAAGLTRLSIEQGVGGLSVTGDPSLDRIEVRVTLLGPSGSSLRLDEVLDFSLADQDGTANLEVRADIQGMRHTMETEVFVPSGIDVDILDGDGGMIIEDLDGALTVGDDAGSITIRGIGGDVDVRDADGSLSIDEVRGGVMVDDGSGSLSVRAVDGPVTIEDSEGSIDVVEIGSDVAIRDLTGSIFARDISGLVTIQDTSGSITVLDAEDVEIISDTTGEVTIR